MRAQVGAGLKGCMRSLAGILDFQLEVVDYGIADVFDGVGRERTEGDRRIQFGDFGRLAGVKNNVARGVAADEVAPT